MPFTIDKSIVRTFVALAQQHGVEDVVFSPGSRNAPLIIAFNRGKNISCQVIVDERSAAFFALGIALKRNKPVVLVCTSGTALFNYAPAVAEAYYQQLPLIVASADRPPEWIDQNDNQTIRQYGALRNIVKKSYQLPVKADEKNERWHVNRMINEGFLLAVSEKQGPIHINIPLREPLYKLGDFTDLERCVRESNPELLDTETLKLFLNKMNGCNKILVLPGQMRPVEELKKLVAETEAFPSFVVAAELISNLFTDNTVSVESLFSSIQENEIELFKPDLLISFGGQQISKSVKSFLRTNPPHEHWHIGKSENNLIDTFQCLTHQVNMEPSVFFSQILPQIRYKESDFKKRYSDREKELFENQHTALQNSRWNELKAFSIIMKTIPVASDLHLSNGKSVRLAQSFKLDSSISVYANRGTSGIEGSTSTAAGSCSAGTKITTLISGDISFLYDTNALWNHYLSPRLKMIVINNNGGGIFRDLDGPSELEEKAFFETPHDLDFEKVAALYNLKFLRSTEEQSLEKSLKKMYEEEQRPVLLEVIV